MSSPPASSGSPDNSDPKYDGMDERKRKRMVSNRESARRSRMRKQQHVDGLVSEVARYEAENKLLVQKIESAGRMYDKVKKEQDVLKAQLAELSDTLQSLNAILQIAQDASGLAMDIPELPENLMVPWQLPCPEAFMEPWQLPCPEAFMEPWQLPCPYEMANMFQC